MAQGASAEMPLVLEGILLVSMSAPLSGTRLSPGVVIQGSAISSRRIRPSTACALASGFAVPSACVLPALI